MPTSLLAPDVTANEATRRFHDETYVFDGLSIRYVLEPRYTEGCLAGGVNGTNVTIALEESWDDVLRNLEVILDKIAKSDLMMLCLQENDRRFAGYDARFVRPKTVPALAKIALFLTRPWAAKKPANAEPIEPAGRRGSSTPL